MNKEVRTIYPEIRSVDPERGIFDYVASDGSVDSYSEVIAPSGWDVSRVPKNLPVPDTHDYSTIENLVGKVNDATIQNKQLVCRVEFAIAPAIGNKRAQLAAGMVAGGFLKACSVGFVPLAAVNSWDDQRAAEFSAALDANGIQGSDREKVRTIYTKQSLIELSVCILGANPNALLKANAAGIVRDEDLFDLGFKDESDLGFLTDMARVYDGVGLMARKKITASIRALCAANNLSQNGKPQLVKSADAPDGVDLAKRREDQAAFLEEMRRAYEGRPPRK